MNILFWVNESLQGNTGLQPGTHCVIIKGLSDKEAHEDMVGRVAPSHYALVTDVQPSGLHGDGNQ